MRPSNSMCNAALWLCAVWSFSSHAGEFSVSPLRIFLTPTSKTGVVTVANSPAANLTMQLRAMQWTQDADGNDRYEDTKEVIFAPRSLDLPKGAKRLVRIGTEKPATGVQRSYRLFIEQTPPVIDPAQKHAQVSVVVNFGLPIFVQPVAPKARAELQDVKVEKGVLTFKVVNTGNVHILLSALATTPAKVVSTDFRTWYLMPGSARTHKATLPQTACKGPLTVTVRIPAQQLTLQRKLDLKPEMCAA